MNVSNYKNVIFDMKCVFTTNCLAIYIFHNLAEVLARTKLTYTSLEQLENDSIIK